MISPFCCFYSTFINIIRIRFFFFFSPCNSFLKNPTLEKIQDIDAKAKIKLLQTYFKKIDEDDIFFFRKLLSKLVILYNKICLPGAYASEHILFLHTRQVLTVRTQAACCRGGQQTLESMLTRINPSRITILLSIFFPFCFDLDHQALLTDVPLLFPFHVAMRLRQMYICKISLNYFMSLKQIVFIIHYIFTYECSFQTHATYDKVKHHKSFH